MPERVELVAAGDPVEELRAVKDPERSRRIAAAAELADAALRRIMEQGLVGRTERRGGDGAGARDAATSAPRVPRLTRSSPPGPTARCPTPSRAT